MPFSDRLISSDATDYDASDNPTQLESDSWTLDAFGNHLAHGVTTPAGVDAFTSTPDRRNRYALVGETASGTPKPAITPIYDAAGNLVFDGSYAYLYDAWGRLLQVNQAAVASGHDGDINYLAVGEMVKHFTFDAFGRLARVQSPYPCVPGPGESAIGLRSERLYYDGVRRVQETFTDPVSGLGMALEGAGGSQLQTLAQEIESKGPDEPDRSSAPAALEAGQMALEGAGGGEQTPTTTTTLAREYVWGPGGWGVDELLAQFDQDRKASYPVQDAGGDVVSLIDLGGGGGSGGGAPRTVANLVYDAYGRVIAHEHLVPHAYLRAGHKGLFFDRLDVGVADAATFEELPRLAAGSVLIGQNRNRTLHTSWGRFNQSDPYRTGLPVLNAMVYHGLGLGPPAAAFALDSHFRDGPNAYLYLRASPFGRSDPRGLMTAIEMSGVGGIQGMLGALLNGAASVGTSISGLMTSGGIWTLNFTASGALVAGMNADGIMMFASDADAHWNEWADGFNNWGSGGGPQYDPKNMTTSQSLLARDWGVSVEQVGEAIHRVKGGGQTSGALRNADVVINRLTGDAFIKGTTEFIGNVRHELGL